MKFFVPGLPRPQGSKKAFLNKKTGQINLVESAGSPLKDWRSVVALAAEEAMQGEPPLEGPIDLSLWFYLPRPKSHPKTRPTFPTTRPDIDKLARSVLDALTHICYRDDGQVTKLCLSKGWAKPEWDRHVGVSVDLEGPPA